ncbi:hypothetical protein RQP54_01865 [Curvibacter sp. APW13]|uniref:ArnT family glycosyltransferase n=1 Tax=Curvibacter sp. APW13 TaxID=3077236 RepID=UPI0028DFB376|nr:phospholipid carrier-dependent glycosyltransferase [Curvibacter sp. APW13]MDT8989603.1 hypothetical protein [Curvibacter sp. APW13]
MPFRHQARANIALIALVFIAALLYLLGLGSPYAPTNGDEMVYIHIARMTAESGHWLPLQSELVGTRNTKPPLLIWQAMVAGGWGQWWSLAALRLPSVLYTFATTGMLAFFAHRLQTDAAQKWRTACIAAALYLLFFSTFRYGRAYLTSAPETFWLALPMWWVLWQRLRQAEQQHMGWLAATLMGVAMGLGAAYKSFALVAPAAASVWAAWLLTAPRITWPLLWRTSLQLAWSTLIGVGLFALWFVLDPDPAAVWQEFVVAENAGKMSGGLGYWHAALFGAYPMWTQLYAYPANGGLLVLVVGGFCLWAVWQLRQRGQLAALAHPQRVVLAWVLVWLVVFTLPSQRSERYLIPAMPAIAIAMALVWDRIPRIWFALTLLLLAPALILLARIGWVMADMGVSGNTDVALVLVASSTGITAVSAGFFFRNWTRTAALAATAAVYACFGAMVAPLSAADTAWGPDIQQALRDKRVAVPNGFTGQYERFHFRLDHARITPYDAEGRNTGALYPDMASDARLMRLLREFDAVVWLQDDLAETEPSCTPQCRVLATRWHVKSRHKTGEVTLDNLWYPQQWLFRREWLLVPAM